MEICLCETRLDARRDGAQQLPYGVRYPNLCFRGVGVGLTTRIYAIIPKYELCYTGERRSMFFLTPSFLPFICVTCVFYSFANMITTVTSTRFTCVQKSHVTVRRIHQGNSLAVFDCTTISTLDRKTLDSETMAGFTTKETWVTMDDGEELYTKTWTVRIRFRLSESCI